MLSDDEWKWSEFVEIGNNIHHMRGVVRTQSAINALGFSKGLSLSGFVRETKERYELFKILLPKIAEYLDGNIDVVKAAVREYFLIRHCIAGIDISLFKISFAPKKCGVQSGVTCDVQNGTNTLRYYVKTHQDGPTQDSARSMRPPDIKEMFIYSILHSIGMDPEVHFIIPYHQRTIYIATQECHLVLLSKLTTETANNNALLQLDLISRILCLSDCTTNTSNCGQVGQSAMIVNFRINPRQGYVNLDILDRFYKGNSEYKYAGLMEIALKTSDPAKLVIMKESFLN